MNLLERVGLRGHATQKCSHSGHVVFGSHQKYILFDREVVGAFLSTDNRTDSDGTNARARFNRFHRRSGIDEANRAYTTHDKLSLMGTQEKGERLDPATRQLDGT